MKNGLLVVPIFALSLIGCVSQTEYDKLETEKNNAESSLQAVKQELSEVSHQYELILEEQRQAEIERNKKPYINELQALQYIEDNFSFYQQDETYRNVQLRRIDDNSFRVSLEQCTKKGTFSNNDFFWHSKVRTLTVHNNGKYDF